MNRLPFLFSTFNILEFSAESTEFLDWNPAAYENYHDAFSQESKNFQLGSLRILRLLCAILFGRIVL